MAPQITVIADDYGISPSVSAAIRELIRCDRLTGTGCMTLFPEWPEQAQLLRELGPAPGINIGLHLTLTDFAPLSRPSTDGNLPPLPRLLSASLQRKLDQTMIDAELDAQLERFVDGMGRLPDFIDGHQHVHFLPVVRRWLETRLHRLEHAGRLPWLRGAPSIRFATDARIKAKIAFVALIAAGFNRRMAAAGFPIRGPLAGFYNWQRPGDFHKIVNQLESGILKNAIVMCHPGLIDETLVGRDQMVQARLVEFEALRGDISLRA
ncbi:MULTISPECIES: ChbG/HpnK family deacetylase [unclassified Rhizobium]|jgi:predicted glycoside hydrolase/deacetylase ChbG (UPF0249 family)|uniref:ChbG/HpnK family deacetylase n=1 Tax=unclassified Rhizobium TaxID=2613769 RepID=UPI0007C747CB|nr:MULTISPECIES: ChbG/HpnK family deacetylase [unclassified Rhizobium]OJY63922.1 MAG: hypothetical protein BGP09_01535 [Rhizobium sp. 60-20]RKD60919.1 hypothetical protein BJ928_108206 [Rhizobium sp. WW_1]